MPDRPPRYLYDQDLGLAVWLDESGSLACAPIVKEEPVWAAQALVVYHDDPKMMRLFQVLVAWLECCPLDAEEWRDRRHLRLVQDED